MAGTDTFLFVNAVRNTNPLNKRASQQNAQEEYALKDLSTTFTNVTECSVDNSITEEGVGIPEGGTNRCSSYRETNLKEKLRKLQDQLSRSSEILGEKDKSIEQLEEEFIKLHREKTLLEVKLKEKDVELASCCEDLRIEKSKNLEAQLSARTLKQENGQLKKDYDKLKKEKAVCIRKKDVELASCHEELRIEKWKNLEAQLSARAMKQGNEQLKKDYDKLKREKAVCVREKDVELARCREEIEKLKEKDVELARCREEIEKLKKWEKLLSASAIKKENESERLGCTSSYDDYIREQKYGCHHYC